MGNSQRTFGITPRQVIGIIIMLGLLGVSAFVLARSLTSQASKSAAPAASAATQPEPARLGVRVIPAEAQIVDAGVAVRYTAHPASSPSDLTEVSFTLTDPATGQPITPAQPPSVWISSQQAPAGATGAASCDETIRRYVQGTLDARAEIDLNSYYILALNHDASISVIDPLNGVTGISQLYTMVVLQSPGEDWVSSRDGRRLFVSMPKAGQVAVVDTDSFRVVQNIDVGLNPVRLGLQPDGRFLWVGNDSTDITTGGVTVIDTEQLRVVAQIPTGVGQHAIAFSGRVDDSHTHGIDASAFAPPGLAFIANSDAGTVSIIDTEHLEKQADVAVGIHPTSLDVASASDTLYVASATEPMIVAVSAISKQVSGRIEGVTGITAIRMAPGGRWGFAVSPTNNRLLILDATTNQVAHSIPMDGAPDRVSFTEAYAYVHASQKPQVTLVDLAQLGKPAQLAPVTIIGGQTAPSQALVPLAMADIITPIHERGSHVLIANPADQAIYEYMEGMNAPMGSYQNYNRTPRAVRVIDHLIRTVGPGSYSAAVKVPRSGEYQVAFLLSEPRIVSCFSFTTEPDLMATNGRGKPRITILSTEREGRAGAPLAVRLALADARTGLPMSNVGDLTIIAALASGQRTERFQAESRGEGVYEAMLVLPSAGNYTVYFSIPSRQADIRDLPTLIVHVAD